jgi:hypothetical protein
MAKPDFSSRLEALLKRPFLHSLLVVLFYTFLFVAFFSPSLLRGAPLAVGADGQHLYLPNFLGRKVFWDHMIFAGFPMMADPQVMTWYPPALLFSLVPGSWNPFILLAYVLTASFMYGYVLTITESKLAALTSGVILGMSGFMMAHLGHAVVIHSVAWVPLQLWSYEKLRRRWSPAWFVAGSAAIALSFLGGHTPIFTLGFGLAAAYALVLGWNAPIGPLRYYLTCAVMMVLGIGLVAIQIVPTAEIVGESIRSGYKFSDFISHSLPPHQVLMLVFPKVFGGLKESGALPYYGAENLTELTGYVGLLPLLLAAIGLAKWPQRSLTIFWLCVALVAVVLAMGDATPLARLIYHVPVVNQFRAPGRHLLEFSFAVCVLASLGMAILVRQKATSVLVFKVVVLGGVVLIVGAVLVFTNLASLDALAAHKELSAEAVRRWTRWAIAIPLALFVCSAVALTYWSRRPNSFGTVALLFGVLVIDLASFGWTYDWRYASIDKDALQPPEIATRYRSLLQGDQQRILPTRGTMAPRAELPPNLSRLWGVANASGYNSLILSRFSKLLNMQDVGTVTRPLWWDPNDQSLNLAAVRYLLMPRMEVVTDQSGTLWQKQDLQLWLGAGCNTTSTDSVTFHQTDLAPSTAIAIVARLACAVNIPDGAEVVQVKVIDTDNNLETHRLLAGRDVSDWAYDCETVKHSLKHSRAQIFENFAARVYEESCQGHYYRSNFKLNGRKNIKSIELRWTGPSGSMILDKISLIDDEPHSSRPADPMTMGHHWRFVEERDGSQVFENLAAMPRVWLVPEVMVLEAEAIRTAGQTSRLPDGREFDPKQMGLIEKPLSLHKGQRDPNASARVTTLADNTMEVRTESATSAFLVTSDVYYPGWRATVDDRPVELYRANYAFRGVAVPAGNHVVKFSYQPRRFYLGVTISLGCLSVLSGLILVSLARRNREH